ncbi:MAG: TetR/AcrR family transcriptional regulator [Prochloraceae cyanobacterium]|nr:TetR/AcrR family transcriptional regulator [Prochloraceae cyanobacterium]
MVQSQNSTQRSPKSSEKRQTILQAAKQEFLSHGYAATSMERIAIRAGVSKATVYNHFQDKQDLLKSIVKELAQGKHQKIFHPHFSAAKQKEPRIFLQQLGNKILTAATNSPELIDFMRLIIGESGRFPELGLSYIDNIAKPIQNHLAQYFETHRELKIADPQATARVFLGSIVYYIILQEVVKAKEVMPLEKERLIDTLVETILVPSR